MFVASFKSKAKVSTPAIASSPNPRPGKQDRPKALAALVSLLLGFVVLLSFLPLSTTIIIGADEGFAVSKALLYLKGYKFYTDVWCDQPLLHTFLIAQLLKYVSYSILWPRLLTITFSFILLISIFSIAHQLRGWLVAGLTVLLLIASPGFLELSASCMVEIPALAPPITALAILLIGTCHYDWLLAEAGAGILFGAGLHIKLNAAIYIPLAVFFVWLSHRKKKIPGKNLIVSLLSFFASVTVTFMVVHSLIGEGSYALQLQQAWESHLGAVKSLEYGAPADHPFPWGLFFKNWDTTVPAIFGIVVCCRGLRRDPWAALPIGWLSLTILIFALRKPWWPYYYAHTSVPLCWCAAIGIQSAGKAIKRRARLAILVVSICALGSVAWMSERLYLQITNIRRAPQTYDAVVLKEILPYKTLAGHLFTDRPIYSFHTGIPMPPRLGVLSLKRFWSGEMTNARLVDELRSSKPGLILLANDSRQSPCQTLLNSEYHMIYEDEDNRLYALKEVIDRAHNGAP